MPLLLLPLRVSRHEIHKIKLDYSLRIMNVIRITSYAITGNFAGKTKADLLWTRAEHYRDGKDVRALSVESTAA